LYDLVNNEFYTNAGSGTFIAGKEVSQYIYGHEIAPIKEYGMYTVTATNGEKTKTQDVLVDAAIGYEIAIAYKLYLYNAGDECEDVTGGWGVYALNENVASVKNATNMYLSTTRNSGGQNRNRANTLAKVDVTNFNKLYFELSNTGNTTTETHYFRSFGLVSTLPVSGGDTSNYIGNCYVNYALTDDGVKEIDISDVAGEYYICFFQGITRNTQIDRVWLD
jgi:hypothetical protein